MRWTFPRRHHLSAGAPHRRYAKRFSKADEGQVLLDLLGDDPALLYAQQNQTLIADKNYFGRDFETTLSEARRSRFPNLRNRLLTCTYIVAGAGFEPATSGL